MMKRDLYKIVVYLVEPEADDDGVTTTEIPCANYVTEACCPWCAVQQWSEELDVEESS